MRMRKSFLVEDVVKKPPEFDQQGFKQYESDILKAIKRLENKIDRFIVSNIADPAYSFAGAVTEYESRDYDIKGALINAYYTIITAKFYYDMIYIDNVKDTIDNDIPPIVIIRLEG